LLDDDEFVEQVALGFGTATRAVNRNGTMAPQITPSKAHDASNKPNADDNQMRGARRCYTATDVLQIGQIV
jgi:hypothetical protein